MSAPAETDWEAELAADVASYAYDPLGFILYAFPWGEPGTILENLDGPDQWQADNLRAIGEKLRANRHMPVLDAVAAANGVGKSAELAWIFWWLLATHEDTRLTVTAGTQAQLSTKTHAEISKWHKLLICGHWFEVTAEKVFAKEKGKREHWCADFIPWSAHRADSFQGLHNFGKRLGFLIDEASGVADVIWQAMYGSLTDKDTEIFMIARANPMRREGEFYKVFTGPQRGRWNLKHVSGWDSAQTNHEQLEAWRKEHGEDSDFYKVRVLGQFPSASDLQFISADVVKAARRRRVETYLGEPLIIGADIGRTGDATRIVFRRGNDARSIPSIKLPFMDSEGHLMQVAARIAQEAATHGADAIFIDATGMGWGVVDRLKQMKVENVHAIGFGDDPLDCWKKTLPFRPRDRKMEIWGMLKYSLPYLAIEDAQELEDDLCGPHSYQDEKGEQFMESKKDLAKRGIASPDWGEALCCTYGAPVMKVTRARAIAEMRAHQAASGASQPLDNNPFADVGLG